MSNGPRYRGKTFHEYMSAKFWHPASKRNIVTVWKRKQQMEADKRKADTRGEEARREHERNMVRAAMGDKKAKLGITWMYDMPNNIMPKDINAPENQGDRPGMTAKNFEIKFDWQKNAPRDSHFNDMGEVRNSIFNHKPFGIEVRNVKCLKCGEWGHSNFDRVCPLFGKVGDRDNPEFDIQAEQMEILSSRLTENSTQGYRLKKNATQHVGDAIFDPMHSKKKKVGNLELEYLKQLDPKEKEALLEKLEKERKKKKKMTKKKKSIAKEELKKEFEKATTKIEPKMEPDHDQKSDDEPDEPIADFINIDLPKRKADIEKEERLTAKREFARKLAEIQAMYEADSDSSDSDSSDSDSESDSDSDSDYDTKSSGGSSSPSEVVKIENIPEEFKFAPPPKPGMVLVKRKRSRIDIDEEKAKRQKMEKLKMLEMTKLLRKKMEEKQKAEMAEQQRKLKSVNKKVHLPSTSAIVSDQDLTSGLLDCLSDKKSTWKAQPLIAYGDSSDED